VYEKVIERRINERVERHDNQFGFRPGRGEMEFVFMRLLHIVSAVNGIRLDVLWCQQLLLTPFAVAIT